MFFFRASAGSPAHHYGTTSSIAQLPIWVAKDAGYFAKNGDRVISKP